MWLREDNLVLRAELLVVGAHDDNPQLDSVVCEVEFPDGQVREHAANIIAENMLTQVDSKGCSLTVMDGIVDYQRDDSAAVPKSDQCMVTKWGQRCMIKSARGWSLLVR